MCLHLYWDVAIAIVICLNVLCMSLEHYQMSEVRNSSELCIIHQRNPLPLFATW